MAALLAFVGLNAVGLLLPGVGWRDAVVGVASATAVFGSDVHNGSLYGVLTRLGLEGRVWALGSLAKLIVLWAVLARVRPAWERLGSMTVPLALLPSPLAWPTYQLCLIPAIARQRGRKLWAIGVALVAGFAFWHVAGVGASGLVSAFTAVAVLTATAASSDSWPEPSSLYRDDFAR